MSRVPSRYTVRYHHGTPVKNHHRTISLMDSVHVTGSKIVEYAVTVKLEEKA